MEPLFTFSRKDMLLLGCLDSHQQQYSGHELQQAQDVLRSGSNSDMSNGALTNQRIIIICPMMVLNTATRIRLWSRITWTRYLKSTRVYGS